MYKNRLALCFCFLFALMWSFSSVSALADNSHIPDEYESSYHHLLQQRQHLMDDRADSIRNLSLCDSWIAQCDKAVASASSAFNRQKLLSSRAYLIGYRDQLRKNLDSQEMALHNLEKDLAWVEGEMKHFACMEVVHFH